MSGRLKMKRVRLAVVYARGDCWLTSELPAGVQWSGNGVLTPFWTIETLLEDLDFSIRFATASVEMRRATDSFLLAAGTFASAELHIHATSPLGRQQKSELTRAFFNKCDDFTGRPAGFPLRPSLVPGRTLVSRFQLSAECGVSLGGKWTRRPAPTIRRRGGGGKLRHSAKHSRSATVASPASSLRHHRRGVVWRGGLARSLNNASNKLVNGSYTLVEWKPSASRECHFTRRLK